MAQKNKPKAREIEEPTIPAAWNSLTFSRYRWNGQQTADEAATGYKHYYGERVNPELTSTLNADQDGLQKRIASAIQKAGVTLAKNETLNFKVGGDGKITVDAKGLSADKAKAIEKALNSDGDLAQALRLNAAAKRTHNFETNSTDPVANLLESDPKLASAKAALLDDWLQQTLGFGLRDLSLDDGKFALDNPNNTALMNYADSAESGLGKFGSLLYGEVASVLKAMGKSDFEPFEASFTFAGGALSNTEEISQAKTSGAVADLFEALKNKGATLYVAADGTTTITGAEGDEIDKLLEAARKDGSLDQLKTEHRQMIEAHIAEKGGGKVEDFVVAYNSDGSTVVIHKDDIPQAEAGEEAKPTDGGKIAEAGANFADALKKHMAVLGHVNSQAFTVNVGENGHISLSPNQPHLTQDNVGFLSGLLDSLSTGIAKDPEEIESSLLASFRDFMKAFSVEAKGQTGDYSITISGDE